MYLRYDESLPLRLGLGRRLAADTHSLVSKVLKGPVYLSLPSGLSVLLTCADAIRAFPPFFYYDEKISWSVVILESLLLSLSVFSLVSD